MNTSNSPKCCGVCVHAKSKCSCKDDTAFCKLFNRDVKTDNLYAVCGNFKKKNPFTENHPKINGITFNSVAKRNRFVELKALQKKGKVLYFTRNPMFDLGSGEKYRADFLIFWSDGTHTYEKTKGYKLTEVMNAKKRIEDKYPVKLVIIDD